MLCPPADGRQLGVGDDQGRKATRRGPAAPGSRHGPDRGVWPWWVHSGSHRQFGLRFSRNACIPSVASGVWLAAAITSIAYAYAFGWSMSTWA